MANETEIFSIDLDNKEFISKVGEAAEALAGIGGGEGGGEGPFKNALDGLGKIATAAGVVGAAYLAVKTITETVFKGEEIEMVRGQFDALTQQMGVSGQAIKDGMTEASEGVLSNTETLKLANEAMIKLGQSSSKIPEIMEVATAASKVTGRSVSDTFQTLTQAIASGQTRQLKSMGIIVDTNKAYRDYAKSIGVTVESLSQQAKVQAVANAALEQGEKVYENVNLSVDTAKVSFERLMAVITNLKDLMIVAFEKVLGPTVAATFKVLGDGVEGLTTSLTTRFGTGSEQTAAKVKILESQISSLNDQIERAEAGPKEQNIGGFLVNMGGVADQARQKLTELNAQLAQAKASLGTEAAPKAMDQSALIDLEKKKAQEALLQGELLKIQEAALKQRMALATESVQVDENIAAQKVLIQKQYENQKTQLEAEGNLKNIDNSAKIAALAEETKFKLIKIDDETESAYEAAMARKLKVSKNTADGITAAFQVGATKNAKMLTDFSAQGQKAFDAIGTNASAAFQALGSGAADAGQALKMFMFGALGDIAIAQGQELLMFGIGSLNPGAIAGGGALIALGGFLKSQSGGATGTSVPTTSSGLSAGSVPGGFGTSQETTAPPAFQAQQQKAVGITIQGSYFETQETRQRLMEIIRESSDYTSFTLNTVGGG